MIAFEAMWDTSISITKKNMRSFVLFNTALGMEEKIGKSMKKPQAQTCGGNTVDLMLRGKSFLAKQ